MTKKPPSPVQLRIRLRVPSPPRVFFLLLRPQPVVLYWERTRSPLRHRLYGGLRGVLLT